MIQIIKIKLKKMCDSSYPVMVGYGTIKKLPILIKKVAKSGRIIIITDNCVKKLYSTQVVAFLKEGGYKCVVLDFPAGERNKTQITVNKLQNEMFRLKCDRDTFIIALGGGVVGDMAGFVAATYMRGIPYMQIPTTVLSMVDSSIGGKTGIDTKYGKNLIGAFNQPKAVIIDFDFLKTLSRRQFVSGLVETVKIFLAIDAKMFRFFEDNLEKILERNEKIVAKIIRRSLELKAAVVERDEKEIGERLILNLGHTIGHALETTSKYELLHGEAIALGIFIESKIANHLNLLKQKDVKKIEELIIRLGINPNLLMKFNINKLVKIMKSDKKGVGQFVLLKVIGEVKMLDGKYVQPVEELIIRKAIN